MRTIAGTTWSVEDAQAYIKARVKIDENGCWIWQRRSHGSGYVCHGIPLTKRTAKAHRTSYEAFVGPIPIGSGPHGTVVMHVCDVRACCNPDHLRLGTQAENMADRNRKGRQASVAGSHHGMSKLTEADVLRIRASGATGAEIARLYGITPTNASFILRRKTWRHI